MSLLDCLCDGDIWESFFEYKDSLAFAKEFTGELRSFIDKKVYLPVADAIQCGKVFPLPRKSIISKQFSEKKRTVYTYPQAENTVLKLLTFLLCRKYDYVFADSLYSFRPNRTAKQAVKRFACLCKTNRLYAYKADISDYFNSIPIEALLPMLKALLEDDEKLYSFLSALLSEDRVLSNGKIITERKGIMAGTPLAAFYANLYLCSLDRRFEEAGIPYARYSDDIILFADSPDKLKDYADEIRAVIGQAGLTINPKKETTFDPSDGWCFLGFDFRDDKLDIAKASIDKIKHKMRRKARALERWQRRNELDGEKAAKAFIRVFNRKLFECPGDNKLSWAGWYFPVIGTDESLKLVDRYAQELLRSLITGTKTKARFNARYEDLKRLGYKSLVHEYYAFRQSSPC